MTRSRIFKLAGLVIVIVLAVVVYRLLGTVIGAKVEQQVAKVGLTPNQVAAHGPLPGDVSLYAKELACQQKIPTPGYYSSLNGAEISDSERSGRFPCATFTGSFDEPNQVYAWRSADDYPGISYINNRKPGELYIVGGEYPTLDDPNMVGPFIAKANATTGKEIWRTYLDNLNASGHWIGNANLNILAKRQHRLRLVEPDRADRRRHRPDPEAQHPARRRGARRRRELQAPHDRARRHVDPQGPDAPRGVHAAGNDGDHQVRGGGHEGAELGAGRGRSRDTRGARLVAPAGARPLATHHRTISRQDRDLHGHDQDGGTITSGIRRRRNSRPTKSG